jgi:hypothetical protein
MQLMLPGTQPHWARQAAVLSALVCSCCCGSLRLAAAGLVALAARPPLLTLPPPHTSACLST